MLNKKMTDKKNIAKEIKVMPQQVKVKQTPYIGRENVGRNKKTV